MHVIKNLDWSEIIERLKNFATSESARLELTDLGPLATATLAEKSFYDIESATFVIQSGVRPHMESLDLFEPWISRLKKSAVLKTLELKDIRHFCLETIALKEALSEQSTAWAMDISELLMNASEPLSAIDHLMTPNCEIRMDASEALYRLSKEKETLARQIQTQMDRLVADHKMDHMLQEKYVTTREGRWVIPVKGGMQHYVPGVIHASSHTKQTVFIEPEVVIPMNNRLRQIDSEIDDEVERLLVEISNYLSTQKNNFEKSKNELLKCDVQISKAQLTTLLGAEACRFANQDDRKEIYLKDLFHPMLKMNGKKPIANTVHLTTEKSILMLSGPNAGGKTVLLKSIGLAAQMARCGLPICAEKNSVIPFFSTIAASIGDSQSVDEDLSTFAAHLKTLDAAQKLSGQNNLILIDEICGSTDPEEGSALARAFIETYAENKVFGVITSHLSPLKSGWKPHDVVINGSLEYDSKSGKPTYQFLHGIPGDSLAILTAKRVGVSPQVLAKAHEHLSPLAKQKLSHLEDIENLKKDLSDLQNKYKKDLKDLDQQKKLLADKIKDFEKQKESELEKTLQRASKKVDDEIANTKASSTLDKHRKLQEIKYNMPEIIKNSTVNSNQNTHQTAQQIKTADEFSEKFPPGSKVFVQTLNQDGIIQSRPNAKGEILVLSQSIRLQIHYSELKPAQKFSNPTSQLVNRSGASQGSAHGYNQVAFMNEDRVVDLRGKTVEVALSDLESALDLASVNKEDRMKLIHGHGTEALKKSIRTFLSRSVYVKKWKAGTPESGGDGVTWVELGLT